MSENNFFWRIQRGELPPPNIAKTLGLEAMEPEPDQNGITTVFNIGEEFTNPAGHVQGGIITAMLDDTMGPAVAYQLGENEFAPTLNLNISFVKGAKPGKFTGKGTVVNKGRSICYLSGQLFDSEGNLIATGSATAKINKMG